MAARGPKVIHPRRVTSTFLLSGLLFCSRGRAMTACSAKSGKLGPDELAPRVKELRLRRDECGKARVLVEAEMAARGVQQAGEALVRTYAEDLRVLLHEADLTERKAFLRSFVKRIEQKKGK